MMAHIAPNSAGAEEPQRCSLAEKAWDNLPAQAPHQDYFGFSLSIGARGSGWGPPGNVPRAVLAQRPAGMGGLCPCY